MPHGLCRGCAGCASLLSVSTASRPPGAVAREPSKSAEVTGICFFGSRGPQVWLVRWRGAGVLVPEHSRAASLLSTEAATAAVDVSVTDSDRQPFRESWAPDPLSSCLRSLTAVKLHPGRPPNCDHTLTADRVILGMKSVNKHRLSNHSGCAYTSGRDSLPMVSLYWVLDPETRARSAPALGHCAEK